MNGAAIGTQQALRLLKARLSNLSPASLEALLLKVLPVVPVHGGGPDSDDDCDCRGGPTLNRSQLRVLFEAEAEAPLLSEAELDAMLALAGAPASPEDEEAPQLVRVAELRELNAVLHDLESIAVSPVSGDPAAARGSDAADESHEYGRAEVAATAASLETFAPRRRRKMYAQVQRCAANDPTLHSIKWCASDCSDDTFGLAEISMLAAALYRNTALINLILCCNPTLDDAAVAPLLEAFESDPRFGKPQVQCNKTAVTPQLQARLDEHGLFATLRCVAADNPEHSPIQILLGCADADQVRSMAAVVAGTAHLQCIALQDANDADGPKESIEKRGGAICADAVEALARAVAQSGVVGYLLRAERERDADYDSDDSTNSDFPTGATLETARTAALRRLHAACVANTLRRVAANDPDLLMLGWNGLDFLSTADVAALAEVLVGNTHLSEIWIYNDAVNDEIVAPLRAALPRSSVIRVEFSGSVSEVLQHELNQLVVPNLCAVVARDDPQHVTVGSTTVRQRCFIRLLSLAFCCLSLRFH